VTWSTKGKMDFFSKYSAINGGVDKLIGTMMYDEA
jgi:hypothetical protein